MFCSFSLETGETERIKLYWSTELYWWIQSTERSLAHPGVNPEVSNWSLKSCSKSKQDKVIIRTNVSKKKGFIVTAEEFVVGSDIFGGNGSNSEEAVLAEEEIIYLNIVVHFLDYATGCKHSCSESVSYYLLCPSSLTWRSRTSVCTGKLAPSSWSYWAP